MTLGDFIRIKRLEKRMTQTYVASCANMRQYEICALETYNRPIPKKNKLILIAQGIGVDPDLLILMAGQIPQDIQTMIVSNPVGISPHFLGTFKTLRESHA